MTMMMRLITDNHEQGDQALSIMTIIITMAMITFTITMMIINDHHLCYNNDHDNDHNDDHNDDNDDQGDQKIKLQH